MLEPLLLLEIVIVYCIVYLNSPLKTAIAYLVNCVSFVNPTSDFCLTFIPYLRSPSEKSQADAGKQTNSQGIRNRVELEVAFQPYK
ncbi:MAG: hypothetical protein AB1589_39260 [Cyanobacteriota bacterium]